MYLELAKRNLERAKSRSILAVVGIIIGVMAVASIGIFGNSMQKSVAAQFEDFANEIIIFPAQFKGYSSIEKSDILKIDKLTHVESAIPVKQDRLRIEYKKERAYTTVYGLSEDYVKELFNVDEGSIKLKGSCVVGAIAAQAKDLRVGAKIKIENNQFRVSGILKEEGRRFDINPDMAIFLSEDDFNKVSDKDYNMVVVKVDNLDNIDSVVDSIEKTINGREEKVRIFKLESILERVETTFSNINNFLMAIAAISLLVAGVSILNIMLMSTVERTKEIGVMRAIGAYRESILKIFLLEALILGVIGSFIGGILSVVGGYAIDSVMLKSAKYLFDISTLFYVGEGFVIGVATAVASGLYPAWKASKLEPIEALRYE